MTLLNFAKICRLDELKNWGILLYLDSYLIAYSSSFPYLNETGMWMSKGINTINLKRLISAIADKSRFFLTIN